MKAERIRQLPVLDGRRLVGLLSERDLEAVASLAGTDLLLVEDAMVPDVFITSDDAPLAVVASEMAARKVESAVVVRGDEVVGVLTSVDTLRALADVLLAANVSQVALSGVAA
jgi:acetoin utilization protein AcuB